MKVLVTGANGFVGSALIKQLVSQSYLVHAAVRRPQKQEDYQSFVVGEIGSETNWANALKGVDVVVHLAARVHVMNDIAHNPLDQYRKVNVAGTRRLAEMAVAAGVKRFVYVSSIGVNGAVSDVSIYSRQTSQSLVAGYALSKWEAEQLLHEMSAKTGIEVVIVRPPLVYGLKAPGNFAQMVKVLNKGSSITVFFSEKFA